MKTLSKIQYGIFFSKPLSRPDLLTREISDNYTEYFDGVPYSFPMPADIVDYPIAQLKSKDKKWQLEVCRSRADIIFTPNENSTYYDINDLNVEDRKIKEMLITIADQVRQKLEKAQISRLTVISTFNLEVDNPETYLRDMFFKDTKQEYMELSVRFNNPFTADNILFNNVSTYDIEENGVSIQKDFNTHTSNAAFTNEEIKKFWEVAKVIN